MKLLAPINKFLRKTREKLSHYPVIYAMFGGVGIILFWRGVWHTADFISILLLDHQGDDALNYANLLDSLSSMTIGFILLLFTGLFVYDFIGAKIISSGIKTEEKIVEKTEEEERGEAKRLDEIEKKFEEVTNHLDEHLENIEEKLKDK